MASTLKVNRIETPDGVGNISFAQPISGDGSQLTDLNVAGSNLTSLPAAELVGTIASGVDGSGLINIAIPDDSITGGKIDLSLVSGDMIYANNPDSIQRLAKGTDGEVLTLAGGVPSWATAPGGGKVLQIKNYAIGTVLSGTTNMPDDNTIPQNSEGIECMVLAFTPTSATSRLTITAVVNASSTSSGQWIMALFQDATVDALSTAHIMTSLSAGGHLDTGTLIHDMVAGTTSETTFKIRAGWGTSVFYFNAETYGSRQAGSQGGSLCSRIQIMEYTPGI